MKRLAASSKQDNRFQDGSMKPAELGPGAIEYEFGIPIPGQIVAKEDWANSALKRLPEKGELNFVELFGRHGPIAIDIGCGNGRFVLSSAVRRPDWNHVGIDILPMVIRYATRRANQRGLANCRFAACDGWRFLEMYCGIGSIDEIHIYHPQPYADPDQKHKRLLNPAFIGLVCQKLKSDGRLFLQTDNPSYWQYLTQVVSTTMLWHEQPDPWPEDPNGRSRREFIAVDQGLKIFRGWAQKRSDLNEESLNALLKSLPEPTFEATGQKKHKRGRPPRRRSR
jgi:tRNA (guanine-N7-)-methyltransferase